MSESTFRCMDCDHVFPESELARWIGEFGAYTGCPKCQCDDLDEIDPNADEKAYERQQEKAFTSYWEGAIGPDETYRRDMIEAGRGHQLR